MSDRGQYVYCLSIHLCLQSGGVEPFYPTGSSSTFSLLIVQALSLRQVSEVSVVHVCQRSTWQFIMMSQYLSHTHTHARARTHTHTHTPSNGPLSGTTRVSGYQKGKTNLDFTEARDSEWQWHQLGHMQVCTLLQTDNHTSTPPLSFLQAGCLSCRPINSIKALKAQYHAWCEICAAPRWAVVTCDACV